MTGMLGHGRCYRQPLSIWVRFPLSACPSKQGAITRRSKLNHSEHVEIFPIRLRCLAIATSFAASLALFPALLLFNPILLAGGAILQPRFPNAGRWFMWAAAAQLSIVLITYDVLFFSHSVPNPHYTRLIFSVASMLILWCDLEFVANGITRIRPRDFAPKAIRPVRRVEWIFAVVLSLLVCWETAWAPSAYRHSGNLSSLAMPLVQSAIVAAFDISLIRRAVRLKEAPHTKSPTE